MDAAERGEARVSGSWSPWRVVVTFGLVSLFADMIYEGMRSVAGPFLGSLGASALVVGVVTGAGEAIALVLRLVSGAWADQADRHWRLTVVGYALTAVCVPLLALAPFVGVSGLAVATTLILCERVGKAVRSPSKSALLARFSQQTGLGRGFGVHKALDQVGAFAGPLLLAGAAAVTGATWPGLALLAVPGAIVLVLLQLIRRRVPDVVSAGGSATRARSGRTAVLAAAAGAGLPRSFHVFALAAAAVTAGLTTFGVISYRFTADGLVPLAAVPLLYAAAMAAGALTSLLAGALYDRIGGLTLLGAPVLVAAVPGLVFVPDTLWPLVVGVVVWGAAAGVMDSTVKAFVAHLVPTGRRATAYGVFAAVQGVGALVGGTIAGALVVDRPGVLVAGIGGLQLLALVLVLAVARSAR